MNKKDPFFLLIENCVGKLSLMHSKSYRFELGKNSTSHTITIFQEDEVIYLKEIPLIVEEFEHIYYEIARDLVIKSLERLADNHTKAKNLFGNKSKMSITQGNW